MAKVYVGNLPLDCRVRDIEDLFWKYGRIRDIDLKTPSRPPAFAFVTFESVMDAEDAIRGRDGVDFEGQRLRVEMSRASGGFGDDRGGGRGGYGGGGGGGYRGGGGYDDRGPPRGGPSRDLRRSEFRVIISQLPPTCSWQDLKDFMRQAGDVIYTDVDRQGGGVVEFSNKSDQEYAVKKLDDTEFKDRFGGERAYVRVKFPKDQAQSRSGSRNRSRSRSRERRSRSRSRSRSARREESPRKDEDKKEEPKADEPKDD
mmetsp:Transcript_27345/g.53306  ORF Transcript_27345/g.53306 Transcript_27345/m.53306 type:complete len:257 (+) Transcript_27345:83-853(+)